MSADCLVARVRDLARSRGYAVAVFGGMRDPGLICAPWTEDAEDPEELVDAIRREAGDFDFGPGSPSPKAHGRLVWSVYFAPNPLRSNGMYLDVSVMPRKEGR